MRYKSKSRMYHIYHSQNDLIAISRDLLIFENKINIMMKYFLMNFIDIFNDINEKESIIITRFIFSKIKVLSFSKVIISTIMMI